LYQVNATFFSALGCDDNRYLIARLIQFLSPGIPQVYYAGLLAASNDMGLLEETGVGRDINRPHFTASQIATEMQRPVVRHLVNMARFRNTHPAFDGTFHLGMGPEAELRLEWIAQSASIKARIDLATRTFSIDETHGSTHRTITDWSNL